MLGSVNVGSFINSWNNFGGTIKGFLQFKNESGEFITWEVTAVASNGVVGSGAGYNITVQSGVAGIGSSPFGVEMICINFIPAGAQGTTGLQGAQGATGIQGSTGTQGITGIQGTTGTQAATGTQGIETDTGLTYNPNSGLLTVTTVSGNLTGNVTGNTSGSSGSCTGNAATATEATNVTVSANNSTDETTYIAFVDGATGTQGIETDTGLTYNPSSGLLTSTSFSGNLTGNATGNASGSSKLYRKFATATGNQCNSNCK